MGGKYNSLKFILPNMPDNIKTFYDVFAGSGTVALNVKADKYVLNDRITPLTDLHEYLKSTGFQTIHKNVLEDIEEYELNDLSGEGFLRLRRDYNNTKSARKLYALTQHSFNYLMRFNRKGEFNASFGKGKCRLGGNALDKLRGYASHFSELNTTIKNVDFRDLINVSELGAGDYVYLDPPYEQTLANYNENRGFTGWGQEDAEDVRELLVSIHNAGAYFGYSNTIVSKGVNNEALIDFITRHRDFKVATKEGYINGVPSSRKHRGKDVEVFITNA